MTGHILEGPKLKSPVPQVTLGQFFFDNAEKYGNKICQIDGTIDATETFASVKCRSTRLAIALQSKGITPNDVIASCCNNSLDAIIPYLATLFLGAKAANLSPALSVRHTKHLITLASPKIVFADEDAVELVEKSLKETNLNSEIVVLGASDKYTTFDQLCVRNENEEQFKPVAVDVNETALLFFSSGTTGLPKAICHSHKSFLHVAYVLSDVGKTILHFSPFYWVSANFLLVYCFINGTSRAFLRSADATAFFNTVQKYKVNIVYLAPVLSEAISNIENATSYDISSLRAFYYIGSSVTSSQYETLVKTFINSNITTLYGMTESGLISIFETNADEHFIKTKPTSCGKVAKNMKLKIVDVETNTILGPNQKGEIRLHSSSMMTGYYNADFSNAFDESGYLKTGDIGYYDEDECIYIVARIKEIFKYQAWQIIPSAIEEVLTEHPAVREAVVFGVPWGDDGQAPAACVVLKEGARVDAKEIEAFVAGIVSEREKLRGGITIVESFPRTPSGKVIRKDIIDSITHRL